MTHELIHTVHLTPHIAWQGTRAELEAMQKEGWPLGGAKAERIKELEAKLAKAQGALHQIAGKKDYADDPWGIARTTLAELKGQDDER
jgi:hypothetical protein